MPKTSRKTKACIFLDTSKSKPNGDSPIVKCLCRSNTGCPKKESDAKRHLNWMCWRMGK